MKYRTHEFSEFQVAQQKKLRAELALLRSRHDSGAVSPAVYEVIRKLECDLAWLEHSRRSS